MVLWYIFEATGNLPYFRAYPLNSTLKKQMHCFNVKGPQKIMQKSILYPILPFKRLLLQFRTGKASNQICCILVTLNRQTCVFASSIE